MRFAISSAVALTLTALSLQAQPAAHPAGPPELKWGPAPAVYPAGAQMAGLPVLQGAFPRAQMAVLQGNPGGTGLFTVRLRMPDGYRIAPHTHPTDEHVTVISGTFRVGMGTKFDTKSLMSVPAGGFVTAGANQPHYGVAQGPTIVQVHATGPFALTYVNPADAPPTRAGGSR